MNEEGWGVIERQKISYCIVVATARLSNDRFNISGKQDLLGGPISYSFRRKVFHKYSIEYPNTHAVIELLTKYKECE